MSDRKNSKSGRGNPGEQQGKAPQSGGRRRTLRRSRSSDVERGEREGRRAERERDAAGRRERGRSEERRGPAQVADGNPGDDSAEDTECMVCFCSYDNVFKTPKVLTCGHTFCLECLARINVSSPELKSLTCPVCRKVTQLPHGRDLPHLDNNKDIFRKLPANMQRALSVRFQRNKGKLVLKKPPPLAFGGSSKSSLTLPKLKKDQKIAPNQDGNAQLGTVELGLAQPTTVDVGRPPSRFRGRLRHVLRSNRCYYAVVAAIIVITVVLMLVGILTFVVMPNVMSHIPVTDSSTNRP